MGRYSVVNICEGLQPNLSIAWEFFSLLKATSSQIEMRKWKENEKTEEEKTTKEVLYCCSLS